MLKINAVLDPNPNSWFAGSPSGSRVEGGERDEGLGEICELREKKEDLLSIRFANII